MSFPVAVQLYSVRDNMAEDFEGTIKKVKEIWIRIQLALPHLFGADFISFAPTLF